MKFLRLITLAVVIASFAGAASASMAQVSIKDYRFQPDRVTVHVGDTVT